LTQPFLGSAYYKVKFLLPRPLRLKLRRYRVSQKISHYSASWPIDPHSAACPENWAGWPEGKKFALVLTHDVESARGLERCLELAAIEERLGFRSSFNFVAGDYVSPERIRLDLKTRGFEVGIHGFHHKGNAFRSERKFKAQAGKINRYLKDWDSLGFRAPSMFHDLDLVRHLDIEYDASTFDTDPFEPQPDGMGTIFPFWVPGKDGRAGFVELPYTLPQDHLLFVLMRERSTGIWEKKLDWIASHGGMALLITHPDYLTFEEPRRCDEYPVRYYEEFLSSVKEKYGGQYWHALPRDVARFWKRHYAKETDIPRKPLHVCMPVYTFYESDNRVMRYAEALAKRGDRVEILALREKGASRHEELRGVSLSRIQHRSFKEKTNLSYLFKLLNFFVKSSVSLTIRQLKDPFDLIHVHSVPDFEVFAGAVPKAKGARVILDIHDIVPEFYASKFGEKNTGIVFRALARIERASCRFSDHVIISNHLWRDTLVSRSVSDEKCSVVLNYPDESKFFARPRERKDDRFILIYPGTLAWHQGLDIAIKAFNLIKDRAPKAEFHIFGRGSERQSLSGLIEGLGLGKRVIVKDPVPIEEIASYMADADLGVIPKRNDPFGGEAFSTKILEFMSLGVPVIVARTKIDSFYFDESVVRFVDPDDVDDLAACMISMIEDKDLRDRQARRAREFVVELSWEKKMAEYYGLVDGLVSSKRYWE
jgi:glycosyltransferase involved in cell wall biosynthesis/peptidoglycan/xylan/chitin deacetylase (PgdA/CDA1 family)